MAIEAVARYLHGVFDPALVCYGVSNGFAKHIVDTAGIQIYSCLSHWTDISFRKALLVIGSEEGPFYEPAGKTDIKRFVVLTIHNSPFETVQSNAYAQAGIPFELSDGKVKAITSTAIAYFNKLDFSALSEQAKQSGIRDIYGELSEQYPVAWAGFRQLGGAKGKSVSYNKTPFEKPFVLAAVESGETDVNARYNAVLDGYSPNIDPQLSTRLREVVANNSFFVTDCFKMVPVI
jgi:hypothetical protein